MQTVTIDGARWRLWRITPTSALAREFPHLARQYQASGIAASAYGSPLATWRSDPTLIYQLAGGDWRLAADVELAPGIEGPRRLEALTIGELRDLYARLPRPARAELIGEIVERITRAGAGAT